MENINIQTISREEFKIRESVGYSLIKRAIDIIGSLVGLMLLSPVFIIVAIIIKVEDPAGPVFFGHKRVGLNGKVFKCWKFRSMVTNAEEKLKQLTPKQKKEFEENFKLKDDPRITKIGKFIRETSIDELPQIFNILKGEMSIVGPRPIVTAELEKYGKYEGHYKSAIPGLTGYWQVNGRSDTDYDERVMMDMEYLSKRNIFLDIYIIFMTVIKVIKKDGAY